MGGAYTGDSIESLSSAIGPGIIHYYAFEPNINSWDQLAKHPRFHNRYGELSAIQKGLWSVDTELLFDDDVEIRTAARISNEGKKKSLRRP